MTCSIDNKLFTRSYFVLTWDDEDYNDDDNFDFTDNEDEDDWDEE